jgi:hypothetical protein
MLQYDTIDGVWIDNRIYLTLTSTFITNNNYDSLTLSMSYTRQRSLQLQHT